MTFLTLCGLADYTSVKLPKSFLAVNVSDSQSDDSSTTTVSTKDQKEETGADDVMN